MKQILFIIFILAATMANAQLPVLGIGDILPDNSEMECATLGETNDLESIKAENGLLVIFSCNTCPFVVAWEDRYPTIKKIADDNKIGFALVNSNFLLRQKDDSFEKMKAHAKKQDYSWPYLLDNESELANAFGAQTTPHVFLFDKDLKLVYKGTIDDNFRDATKVTEFYLKNALNSLGKGEEIKVKETKNIGCSIKRKTS
jgi:thioredoxin-related protein